MLSKVLNQEKIRVSGVTLVLGLAVVSGLVQAQTTPAASSTAVSAEIPGAPKVRSGTFKSVVGDVRVVGSGGESRPAQSGMALQVQDRVVTALDGSTAITLRDNTVVTIGPVSNVSLDAFSYDATTQSGSLLVRVLEGSVRMLTGLLAKASPQSVQVQTPTSLVGVRGTDFIVEVPKP